MRNPKSQQQQRRDALREERRRFAWLQTLIRDEQRRHRMLFLLSLIGIFIVAGMAFLTYSLETLPFDLDATLELQGVRFAPYRRLMFLVSAPGYYPLSAIMVASGSILVALLLGWRHGAYLAGITAFQGLVNSLLKQVIGRPRPSTSLVEVLLPARGLSFPSGHVMLYTVFFGFLFFLAWVRLPRSILRTVILLFTGTMILLVGPSRIFLGAHWLSDVVAAHILGFIILAFAIEFYLVYLAPRNPKEEEGVVGRQGRAPEQ
jgi:undecaprenyl-diphosphatase